MTEKQFNMFDILKDVNMNKSFQLHKREDFNKQYNPFMVNRFLSMGFDTVFEANFMNRYYNLPKHVQYLFLSSAIDKKNRFLKFIKSDQLKEEREMIKYIRKVHYVNNNVASDMLNTITDEEKQLYKEIFTQKTIRKR